MGGPSFVVLILFAAASTAEYTTAVASYRVTRGGAAPFVMFKGCVVFSFMRNKLKRYYGRKDRHFITFSCYQRKPLLGSAQGRSMFVRILGEVRKRHPFLLILRP